MKPKNNATKPTTHMYLFDKSAQSRDDTITPSKIITPPIVGVPDFSTICLFGPSARIGWPFFWCFFKNLIIGGLKRKTIKPDVKVAATVLVLM